MSHYLDYKAQHLSGQLWFNKKAWDWRGLYCLFICFNIWKILNHAFNLNLSSSQGLQHCLSSGWVAFLLPVRQYDLTTIQSLKDLLTLSVQLPPHFAWPQVLGLWFEIYLETLQEFQAAKEQSSHSKPGLMTGMFQTLDGPVEGEGYDSTSLTLPAPWASQEVSHKKP